MINDFIYDIPVRVYFGRDQLRHLSAELKKYGQRVLMTYGGGSVKRTGLYDRIVKEIREAGLELFELGGIEPNPRIDSVRKGAQMCKQHHIDVLLAVGGGSVIDATKFMAAGACVDFDPWDFLDYGKKVTVEKALPIVDILTLAATGSEMDCGGVITNPETKDKNGMMYPPLLPKASFLDPTNTFTVSAYQTACGATDMMSHIIEVYFNMNQDLYMLDCFMEGLMKTIIRYAPVAMKNPEDYEARANLMWAGTLAHNNVCGAGRAQDWASHGIEHELSALYGCAHGAGLAVVMPAWMAYVKDADIKRVAQFAAKVFAVPEGDPAAMAQEGIARYRAWLHEIGMPTTFAELGAKREDIPALVAKLGLNGNTLGTFMSLTDADVVKILESCC